MPAYRLDQTYSSPVELTPEQMRCLAALVETTAITYLRITTGSGSVAPDVQEAISTLAGTTIAKPMPWWRRLLARLLSPTPTAPRPVEPAEALGLPSPSPTGD